MSKRRASARRPDATVTVPIDQSPFGFLRTTLPRRLHDQYLVISRHHVRKYISVKVALRQLFYEIRARMRTVLLSLHSPSPMFHFFPIVRFCHVKSTT
jgi:hypothetical protein